MRVLLVEDDARLGAALADVLRQHGFQVDLAAAAEEGVTSLRPHHDVVVLDLGLPDRDGFEVCSRIRRSSDVPIIIATARADLGSRVHGLHLGADDYLVKPYDIRELMARIHAVTRRRPREAGEADPAAEGAGPREPVMLRDGVLIDLDRRVVQVGGTRISLTRKEFDLVALLAGRPGVVFSRDQILSSVWETRWRGGQRTLEVHVASVRSKTGSPSVIETVRGVGYRLGG